MEKLQDKIGSTIFKYVEPVAWDDSICDKSVKVAASNISEECRDIAIVFAKWCADINKTEIIANPVLEGWHNALFKEFINQHYK